LEYAVERTKQGAELAEQDKNLVMIGWSNLCLIRVLYSMGDMTGDEEIIRKMDNIAHEHDIPLLIPPSGDDPHTIYQLSCKRKSIRN